MKLIDKDKVISILSSKITDIKLDMKCGFLDKRKGNEKILVFKHIISLVNTLEVKETQPHINIPNIDDILEEGGIEPNSKVAKMFKESYYKALDNTLHKEE